eukprot:gene11713-biopygen12848
MHEFHVHVEVAFVLATLVAFRACDSSVQAPRGRSHHSRWRLGGVCARRFRLRVKSGFRFADRVMLRFESGIGFVTGGVEEVSGSRSSHSRWIASACSASVPLRTRVHLRSADQVRGQFAVPIRSRLWDCAVGIGSGANPFEVGFEIRVEKGQGKRFGKVLEQVLETFSGNRLLQT